MAKADERTSVTAVKVVELMSSPAVCVLAETTLGDALVVMLRSGIRHVVVVDPMGRCHGVVADRAVTAAWASDPTSLVWQTVRALLEPRLAVVGTDSTAADAAKLMNTDRVDAVAVVDRGGRPVGVVAGSDLVRLVATFVPTPPEDERKGTLLTPPV